MSVIEVRSLSKYYRQHFWTAKRKVLDSVSFKVEAGEVFGFLGPNGSGKSTTIKILLGIIYQSSGEAELFDKPIGNRQAKSRLGFLPENPYFYEHLTARKFLEFHGSLWGLSNSHLKRRIPEVLELTGMKGTDDLRLRGFSKGMLQRVGLAQSILHDPDLVILDEPMTGLDPVGRKEVRDLMLELKSRGKTVFFSTHILSDVESICDRVAILNRGKLLSCGMLDELISVDTNYFDMVWRYDASGLEDWFRSIGEEPILQSESIYLKVRRKEAEAQAEFEKRVDSLVHEGMAKGARLKALSPKNESLEEIFMRQVGHMDSRV